MGGAPEEEDDNRNRFACWLALVRTNYVVLFCFVLIVYWPRLVLSYLVFALAQFLRFLARLLGVECGRPVANRRILIITDYLPPQTHGIAIRCQAYAREMRAQGHYVVVFATAYDAAKETSFDHPNIPSIPNPFNLKNRIGYTAGVKLAWFLGAYTWDTVHLVYPSLIGGFVLSCCAWRRIPTYCSHHVEMDIFSKHAPYPLDKVGLFLYDLITKWPAVYWSTLNAAPTLCFAKAHCGTQYEDRLRCVPSGTHDVFTRTPETPDERKCVRSEMFGVEDDKTKVVLMVQRLSQEKGTDRIFPAFTPTTGSNGSGEGQHVKGLLAIAGDGPSKESLMEEAEMRKLNVVFLGNVPHHKLPALYRAADCFVTMSLSETYGLTCLEAQMCGCPAVMPYCDVFNEIWGHRVPDSWRYSIDSTPELAKAIAAAQDGRKYLEEHPVNQTWKIAATELLKQYEECIEFTSDFKRKQQEIVNKLVFWGRVTLFVLGGALISRKYYHAIKLACLALQRR
jgi:glycosyltransferase involved in cell wall biosynthesis